MEYLRAQPKVSLNFEVKKLDAELMKDILDYSHSSAPFFQA